ncbi:MAG: DUF2892 domain-containing protein [Deltaproteobacteria bacterium]|nr:DUF2892 domain-containing protein [Deltaproteobacteria bacterium]
MEKRIGNLDRMIRIIIGIILILIPFFFSMGAVLKAILIIIGIILILTGITRICFLYNLLGINTYKAKD